MSERLRGNSGEEWELEECRGEDSKGKVPLGCCGGGSVKQWELEKHCGWGGGGKGRVLMGRSGGWKGWGGGGKGRVVLGRSGGGGKRWGYCCGGGGKG